MRGHLIIRHHLPVSVLCLFVLLFSSQVILPLTNLRAACSKHGATCSCPEVCAKGGEGESSSDLSGCHKRSHSGAEAETESSGQTPFVLLAGCSSSGKEMASILLKGPYLVLPVPTREFIPTSQKLFFYCPASATEEHLSVPYHPPQA